MHVSKLTVILGQHQMVWRCLTGDDFTRLGYFSAFGGRIGCPCLIYHDNLLYTPEKMCWLLERVYEVVGSLYLKSEIAARVV